MKFPLKFSACSSVFTSSVLKDLLLAFLLMLGTAQLPAAAIITALGESVISSSTPAPGNASDYYYFGVSSQQHLTNFGNVTANSNLASGPYASITAPGGIASFGSGTAFINNGFANTNLISFTLTNAAEPDFNVYFLVNNVTNPGFQTSSLTLNSLVSSVVTATLTQSVTPGTGIITYVGFHIQGAATNMAFQAYTNGGTAGPNQAIGGLTFQAVPEPQNVLLIGLGLMLILLRGRRSLRA